MTNQSELEAAHTALSDKITAAPAEVEKMTLAAVTAIARSVREEAARRKHRIGIRVASRQGGVRITITGPDANRYRRPVQEALTAYEPKLATEIRTMLTRK